MPSSPLQPLQSALDLIEAHLRQPLTISELATRVGFSFWHFQKVFVALVQEPVASYTRRRRITEAALALRHAPERRILDIAMDFGFDSHESFTRAFASVTGTNPREFRAEVMPVMRWARFPILPHQLNLIPSDMSLEPAFVELPALSLVGCASRFIAAMSPDANNMQVIPPLWGQIMARKAELGVAPDAVMYGACRVLAPNQRTREDELEYLAGTVIAPDHPVPAGMARWEIPALHYVKFVHRGPVETFPETLNYVYGSWFPRSKYIPTHEIELECYDSRFCKGSPDSELDYLISIRPA